MGSCESTKKRKYLREKPTGLMRSPTMKRGECFYGKRGDQSE
jgi:hypothetical protein